MSAHAYSEDQLVEQPAIRLFAVLGWQTVSALEETFGAGGTLGRETKGEVVLGSRLRATLVMLNPSLPPAAFTAAADQGNQKDIHGFVTLIPPLQKRFQEIAGAMLAQKPHLRTANPKPPPDTRSAAAASAVGAGGTRRIARDPKT